MTGESRTDRWSRHWPQCLTYEVPQMPILRQWISWVWFGGHSATLYDFEGTAFPDSEDKKLYDVEKEKILVRICKERQFESSLTWCALDCIGSSCRISSHSSVAFLNGMFCLVLVLQMKLCLFILCLYTCLSIIVRKPLVGSRRHVEVSCRQVY